MRLTMRIRCALYKLKTLGLGLLCAAAAQAQTPAPAAGWILSLVDGEATVVDGAKRFAGQPGLRVGPGALVETSDKTTVVRFEHVGDQSTLDLGPGTRAMLLPPALATRGGRAPAAYLLQGWAKLASGGAGNVNGLMAPGLELLPFSGRAVVQVSGKQAQVFAETGTLQVAERRGAGEAVVLPAGTYLAGDGVRAGGVAPRPPADWLKTVPRAFRDTLPLRAAVLKTRPVERSVLPGPTYEQLAHWLAAEPYVRRDFPQRFGALARDPAFRRGLRAHLNAHPEWAWVLDPPPPPASR
jgi:hypothetical protein